MQRKVTHIISLLLTASMFLTFLTVQVLAAGSAALKTKNCLCDVPCTPYELNALCPVCVADPSACLGRADSPAPGSQPLGQKNSIIPISTASELTDVLNSTGDTLAYYQLTQNITIDTNTLRPNAGASYSFGGTLDGDGHTISVQSEDPSSAQPLPPLFDTLRGSVRNLNVEFYGDAAGTTIAYDIGYDDPADEVNLSSISVTVHGDIRYGDHNYLDYYTSPLRPPHNYGNWYIHYGGEPKHLATGFSWYLWGTSLDRISVTVKGDIGSKTPTHDSDRADADATAAGFAYFAAKGASQNTITYEDITVNVKGNIQSYASKGHASAYGFAAGTSDSGTAGFGSNTLDELSYASVSAANIIADSQEGASSAIGFARFMQGYTHHCSVDVSGAIRAVNAEGDPDEEVYAYMNGSAYAYGFMLSTGGSIESRRNFEHNTVTVGEITAQTLSSVYAGSAFASGFAHQMMNSDPSDAPTLSYNNNQVEVRGSISAQANKGGSVAAGFVTNSGRDYYNWPDHIYNNRVEVGGDIFAKSGQSEASASGYAYLSKTHRRDCTVHVAGSITADSPVQAVAAGFVALQYQNDSHYFVKDCQVTVDQDILATGDGMGVAGGLVGVMLSSSSTVSVPTVISGNTVTVKRAIDAPSGLSGLIIGLNDQFDPSKSKITFSGNQFIGPETLLPESTADTLYTNFVGQSKLAAIEPSNNSVVFTTSEGRQYSSPVQPVADTAYPDYALKWELTDVQEIIREYTITYHLDGGSNHPDNPSRYTTADTVTLKDPTRAGYIFLGWTQDGVSSTPQTPLTIPAGTTGNLTFTAHWQKDSSGGVDPNPDPGPGSGDASTQEFELHYRTNGGKYLSVESESHIWTKDYEDLPLPVREGYAFEGWYWDSFLTRPVRGDVKVDLPTVVLYAKWTEDKTVPDSTGISRWLDTVNHKAYLSGYPTKAFCPDRNMTRAEVALMFYALLLDQDVEITASFTDVPAQAQFAKAVNSLASLGMMNGYPDGTFHPASPITRAEFTAVALAFARQGGSASSTYTDVTPGDWFYPYVSRASAYGWMGGYPDGSFRPNHSITRAEACVIVNNMLHRTPDQRFIDQNAAKLIHFADVSADHWAYYAIMEATNSHRFSTIVGKESWTGLLG